MLRIIPEISVAGPQRISMEQTLLLIRRWEKRLIEISIADFYSEIFKISTWIQIISNGWGWSKGGSEPRRNLAFLTFEDSTPHSYQITYSSRGRCVASISWTKQLKMVAEVSEMKKEQGVTKCNIYSLYSWCSVSENTSSEIVSKLGFVRGTFWSLKDHLQLSKFCSMGHLLTFDQKIRRKVFAGEALDGLRGKRLKRSQLHVWMQDLQRNIMMMTSSASTSSHFWWNFQDVCSTFTSWDGKLLKHLAIMVKNSYRL